MKFDGTLPGEKEEDKSVAQVERAIVSMIEAIEKTVNKNKDPLDNAIDVTSTKGSEEIPVEVA